MDLSSLKTSYVILREIGRGGMGVVFQAWDRRLERNVALKILSLSDNGSDSGISEAAAELFLLEAKAVARLNHPNIVTLYDIGGTRGRYFLVMEYVEGYNLEVMASQMGRVPVELVLDIGCQLCDALDYAHRQGIVHRDVKPANVLLNAEGGIKLMDFGIARIQRGSGKQGAEGEMLGSVLYMAPEQLLNAAAVDHRADLYAVGVTLYELLCGRRPFHDESVGELIRAIMLAPVPALAEFGVTAAPGLEQALQRALSKDPDQRYQSAAEFRQALDALRKAPGEQAATPVPAAASALQALPAPELLQAYVDSLLQAAESQQPSPEAPFDSAQGAYRV